MKRLVWLILILITNPFCFFGQDIQFGVPQITNYTPDDYYAEGQNWFVFQDKRGEIYVANSAGVLEFDGIDWKLISLTNNLGAWRIIEDRFGKIYIAGSSEIGYLASDDNCNTVYKSLLPQIPEEFRNFRDVWGLYYYEDKIAAISNDRILIINNGVTNVITKESRISELGCFNDKLYLDIEGEGIYYLENDKLYNAVEINKNIKRKYRRLIKWSDDTGLLAGRENGLFLLKNDQITPWITDLDVYFPNYVVYHIIPVGDSCFAIASVKNGVFIINKNGEIIRHITTKNGLLSNTVYYLFLDNQNILWAANNKGVSCIEIFSPFMHLNEQNNITGNINTSVIFNHKLYLGGEPYLYCMDWPITNDNQLPQATNLELMTGQVYKLNVVDNELFCNHQKGVSVFNEQNEYYTINCPDMCWGFVSFGKYKKNILVCSNTEASVLEKKEGKWKVKHKIKGHSAFEKAIGFDYDSNLWTYARNIGVTKLKLTADRDSVINTKIFTHIGSRKLDSSLELFVINQQVFVCFENKIYAYNSFINDFIEVNFAFEGKILQIIDWEEQESLWARTTEGILHFQKNNESIYCPDFDGYLDFKYLSKTHQVNSIDDSTLIFMHSTGISYYNAGQINKSSSEINARLRQVRLINNDSIIFGGTFPSNCDVFSDLQEDKDIPILEYQHNSIRFSFATAFPHVNKEIKFQFKLENFDKKWSKWTNETSKDYTNLSPGSYVFSLKVKSSNQNTSSKADYVFQIMPPWYMSTEAYVLYLILMASVVVLIYWLIIMRIRKKYKKDKKDFKIDLITNISHEIKTPLSLILSPLEEIVAKDSDTEENRALHMVMYRNAKRLRQLVSLLLDLRRNEEGNMILKVKQFDIVQFIEDLFITFEYTSKSNNIDYQFNTAYESKFLNFDDQKLEIILTNILSNAFKYTHKGGQISVSILSNYQTCDYFILNSFVGTKPNLKIGQLSSKEYVEIVIEDTGFGISKENITRIFDGVYHSDLKNNLNINSTGLGLAFTEKLILMHRGEILVWSKPNYGSKFVVRIATDKDYYEKSEITDDYSLDIADNLNSNKSDDLSLYSDNMYNNRLCIMVVDDEKDMRIYLRKLFEVDYVVIEASNGWEAAKILQHNLPDIIISDIKMPEMDGIELCREIKSNVFTSHIPFLLLTGDNSEKNQFDCFESGANQYVTKPFNPNLLQIRVKKLIENSNKLKKELHFNFNRGVLIDLGTTKMDNLLVRAAEIINNNLSDPKFNINSLALKLNLSRTSFYKRFKECIEITPNEFIQVIRLEKSKSLLDNQELTISEVAYLVGFNDAKYFSTSFKKHFNYSPRDYRKSITESPV